MKIGVVTFPGSLDDHDAHRAVRVAGGEPVTLWHGDDSLRDVDAVVLPGGFSYGDYLRAGAIIQNDHRTFICRDQRLRVENARTAWTSDFAQDDEITIVLKNQDGQYVADRHTLDELEGEGRVAFRYVVDGPDAPSGVRYDRFASRNPNGSYRDIAGVTNERGNVVGLMPHPEHAIEEGYGPSLDGLKFFTSVLKSVVNA